MATTKQRLGKGLSALISDAVMEEVSPTIQKATAAAEQKKGQGLTKVSIASLHHGKYQPRHRFDEQGLEELADSIKKNGVMQPIIVRPSTKYKSKYEIIAGERRWRASKIASLDTVPVIVRNLTDKQALEFALVENVQRKDLSALEEGLGYQRLIEEFSYTQEELSGVVGKSRSHVANMLRLLSLPEEVKLLVDEGKLSMGHARALLTAKNPKTLAEKIVAEQLSVRQAELLAKGKSEVAPKAPANNNKKPSARNNSGHKDPDIIALEESLSDSLGVAVSINDYGQSGEMILAYDSLSELDQILQKLSSQNSAI